MSARWSLWLALAGAVVCAAGVVITTSKPRAAEPDTLAPRWQIWIKRPGENWQVYSTKRGEWSFGLHTSCTLDLASVSMVEPSGTSLACLRIGARTQAPR